MQARFRASVAISAVALILIIVDLLGRRGRVDGWTIGLLAIGALPWFWEVIESVAFPGGNIRFRELEDVQQQQAKELDTQAKEIDTLQFLITHLVTDDEQTHLAKLAAGADFPVFDDTPAAFFDELHHLRALKFITGLPGKGIRSLRAERGDVRDHFAITNVGRQYLDLAAEAGEPSDAAS